MWKGRNTYPCHRLTSSKQIQDFHKVCFILHWGCKVMYDNSRFIHMTIPSNTQVCPHPCYCENLHHLSHIPLNQNCHPNHWMKLHSHQDQTHYLPLYLSPVNIMHPVVTHFPSLVAHVHIPIHKSIDSHLIRSFRQC